MWCASEISGKQIGRSWPKRFCKHHPNLKMKKTTGLEKARTKALNQFAIDEFFNMLIDVIKEFNILPENLYNMDKKNILLGIGARITAMIDCDQQTIYSIEDGNRELVTVIETICADGSVLHPSMIFQGLQRNVEWGHNNPCNVSISISPNGWMDQELGSMWLQNDFHPATQDKAAEQYHLLILDGHNSHCMFTFCKYAADHKIIIICLSSHTLQPCDIGDFGPLAQLWKHKVTLTSQSLIAIRKDNILTYHHAACIAALKTTTIQSAFQKTGIWPLDCHTIPPSAFEPSKNTMTQAAQLLPAHLPSRHLPKPQLHQLQQHRHFTMMLTHLI
ncbi:DDE-domain-containing protein [Tricholoma matsutake]|nr:DDE-domain-containing protein [Tricholoma matsutake 945]